MRRNIVLRHKDMEPFLRTALSSKVSSEFKNYCASTNSVFKGTSPEELAAYPNRFVMPAWWLFCSLPLNLSAYLSMICHHQRIDQLTSPLLGWRRIWKTTKESAVPLSSSRPNPFSFILLFLLALADSNTRQILRERGDCKQSRRKPVISLSYS